MENPQVDQPQAEAKVEAMSVDVVAVEVRHLISPTNWKN